MGSVRNGIKRWPGQLSNALEEVTQTESMHDVKTLLDRADQLKRSLVREQRNPAPSEGPTVRDKDPGRGSLWSAGKKANGMDGILGWLGQSIRSWRDLVREQPWFEDLRGLVGAGLWKTLGSLQLYRLRDAAMENLGLADATGRQGDRATRRERQEEPTGRPGDTASVSSTSLTLLIL